MRPKKRSESFRLRVWHAHGAKIMPCAHCGHWFKLESLTIDHIHPKSLGGRRNQKNTALACPPCNQERGCRDFWEFRVWKRSRVLGVDITERHLEDERPRRFECAVTAPAARTEYKTEPLTHRLALPKGYKCGADLPEKPWVRKDFDEFWLWAMRVKREEDL